MGIAHIAVSVLLAAALTFSVGADFLRYGRVLDAMTRVGVPHSWLPALGVLKAAGALGLLVGLGVPLIGTAAALGVVAFFATAVGTHLGAHDNSFGLAVAFGVLAVAALMLGLPAVGTPA